MVYVYLTVVSVLMAIFNYVIWNSDNNNLPSLYFCGLFSGYAIINLVHIL